MYQNNHSGKYEDIIHLPHHVSKKRPQMAIKDRAAQFSPFAALTGHEAAVKETARLTEEKMELDESTKRRLDETLQMLMDQLRRDIHLFVQITYFLPDEKKTGGSYLRIREKIQKIDTYRRIIFMMDKTKVPIDDIVDIELKEHE